MPPLGRLATVLAAAAFLGGCGSSDGSLDPYKPEPQTELKDRSLPTPKELGRDLPLHGQSGSANPGAPEPESETAG